MGRPRIGKTLKTRKDYTYDFPEQRKLAEGLHLGDATLIANAIGISPQYVSTMLNGTRKMTPGVEAMVIRFREINKLKTA